MDQSTAETAFSAALAGGWLHVCKYLLAKGAHPYAPCVVDGKTQSSLLTAVVLGSVPFVRQLLRTRRVHLSCRTYDPTMCTLAEAVLHGTNEMIDFLLDAGVRFMAIHSHFPPRINETICGYRLAAEDKLVWLRLNFACWRQDLQRIEELFTTYEVLRDQEMMATKGTSVLFLAAYQKNEEIVTMLLARGAQVKSTMADGQTAVVAAVLADSPSMMQFLLKHGGDLNVTHNGLRYETGFVVSLLCIAVYTGAMNCAHSLLPMETRPQQLDQALQIAVRQNDHEFTRRLLDTALPSTENVFHACASTTKCPLMLDLLLTRCCVERYAINCIVQTFQYLNEADLIVVYLAHGLDVNAQAPHGNALIRAVRFLSVEKPEMIQLLLHSGADVHGHDENGYTALDTVERILQDRYLKPNDRVCFEASRKILVSGN